jgi:predicted hotdog family 3-hydroxylacyl-ACP dehydratase
MLSHDCIAALIPHQGTMCLLETMIDWTADTIICYASSHLSVDNPLRRNGHLSTICGCEYGFQAIALHGALTAGGGLQPPGYLVGLRVTFLGPPYLDDSTFGALQIKAMREAAGKSGLIYGFCVLSSAGTLLLEGRATIKLLEIVKGAS